MKNERKHKLKNSSIQLTNQNIHLSCRPKFQSTVDFHQRNVASQKY